MVALHLDDFLVREHKPHNQEAKKRKRKRRGVYSPINAGSGEHASYLNMNFKGQHPFFYRNPRRTPRAPSPTPELTATQQRRASFSCVHTKAGAVLTLGISIKTKPASPQLQFDISPTVERRLLEDVRVSRSRRAGHTSFKTSC